MPLYGTEDRQGGGAGDLPPGGEWRDGVYIPSRTAGGHQGRASLLHDFVRTLLDLRTEQALSRP